MRSLLINTSEPGETRAAVVEQGRVEEYRSERSAAGKLVGNLYKGRVVNLERAIGAAFVDIGIGRNGFLHVSDCPAAAADAEARIEKLFAVGQEVLVQVTRESIGSKGPMLTGNVSFPGRFLVLLPRAEAGGISRRIDAEGHRTKLRALARALEQRAGAGLIIRTAGAERTRRELMRELQKLKRLWASVESQASAAQAPELLYTDSDLVGRALRDLVDDRVTEIQVDTPEALDRARETVQALQPELAERLALHTSNVPLFHAFGIESQIDRLRARRVSLPGGGTLVFDRTEALVAVDVNTGRMREGDGLEETALRTNLEACEEIARQIRLRDLGGVVVVDFIDMRETEHVREVERAFRRQLALDRARIRPGRLGAFGIFALTRQRSGDGVAGGRRPCPRCEGTGELVDPAEVALRVFRELRASAASRGRGRLVAQVAPEVAELLQETRAGELEALRELSGRPLEIRPDPSRAVESWEVEGGGAASA